MTAELVKSAIKTVPDYPKSGIMFRDVTSLMQSAQAFKASIHLLAEYYSEFNFDCIAGTEARGLIFGAPLAMELGLGFIPVRKPNKLPREVISESYQLEYGEDALEMHKDAVLHGEKVLMIDDLLATGGTMMATANLIRHLGGVVEHAGFVVSLPDLGGEQKLSEHGVKSFSICQFEGD